VRVIKEVLDFYAFIYARGHISSGAHNKHVIRKRTHKNGVFHIACFNIVQGYKNPVAHSDCAT